MAEETSDRNCVTAICCRVKMFPADSKSCIRKGAKAISIADEFRKKIWNHTTAVTKARSYGEPGRFFKVSEIRLASTKYEFLISPKMKAFP